MSGVVSTPSSEGGIAVFAKGSRTSGLPTTRVSLTQAKEWVESRVARWVDRTYKAIIMLVDSKLAKIRDLSCTMGLRVVEAALMGSAHHQSLILAWGDGRVSLGA